MKQMDRNDFKICVVGLGYVGLPLAVEFAKHFDVSGFDVKKERIEELKKGTDKTREVSNDELKKAKINCTAEPSAIKKSNFIIVAVPTPITEDKKPDLGFVESASKVVGENLSKGSIVVFESTVYPGVTEDICVPIIEKFSKLKCGKDWKIGYSPERVNPGDKEHTIDRIVKIVSGMDRESLEKIAFVYSAIIKAGIHKAPNIKTAEAAKVIENIQRDLNIALMNELSLIFKRLDINTQEVLEAAGTKWNFHKYHPGLVGGHCIGVDPYYLTFRAQQLGYNPKVILSGREINDSMAFVVGDMVIDALKEAGKGVKGAKVLLMGLTFKENVPDIRNSKAADIIKHLRGKGVDVIGCEPLLEKGIVKDNFNIENIAFDDVKEVDAIILVNAHDEFKKISINKIKAKMKKPVLVDVKNLYFGKTDSSWVYRNL